MEIAQLPPLRILDSGYKQQGIFCGVWSVLKISPGAKWKDGQMVETFQKYDSQNAVGKMLKRQRRTARAVESGVSVGVLDNLHSQSPLWRPSPTCRDHPSSLRRTMRCYQLRLFSWDHILGGGRVLVCAPLKKVRASGRRGSHKTYPPTPLFIASCAL